jgi:hypothetical protein
MKIPIPTKQRLINRLARILNPILPKRFKIRTVIGIYDISMPLTITRQCPFTGAINTQKIEVTQDQIDAWNNGKLIQEVMPDLTAGEREFIKTGITDEVWTSTFDAPLTPSAYDIR